MLSLSRCLRAPRPPPHRPSTWQASWRYVDAVTALARLDGTPTVVGKLRCLVDATTALAAASSAELSADDLVPLFTLLLVTCRYARSTSTPPAPPKNRTALVMRTVA